MFAEKEGRKVANAVKLTFIFKSEQIFAELFSTTHSAVLSGFSWLLNFHHQLHGSLQLWACPLLFSPISLPLSTQALPAQWVWLLPWCPSPKNNSFPFLTSPLQPRINLSILCCATPLSSFYLFSVLTPAGQPSSAYLLCTTSALKQHISMH